MWRTEYGDRILEPEEATLFAESLLSLLEEPFLNDYEDYPLGIKAFDTLTYGQKISVLSTIANGLLRKDVPAVPLTAVLEAAIAAVFEHLRNLIIIELDDPDPDTYWRKIVVAARKEAEGEEIPAIDCEHIEEWDIELQHLSDGILWDLDYDDEDLYADRSPEEARALRKMAGINEDYYQSIAEDLKDEGIESRRAEVRKLCLSVVKA